MHYISHFLIPAGLFIYSFSYSQNRSYEPETSTEYSAPLDIPIQLSSNYGEYRQGHFHAGIDFKTQQVEGKNVLAVDSGYVYRIVVLTGSYGNAVYLKHPNGNITLYGHLSKFEPALANYVKEQQYKKKSFTVDLFPDPGKFAFRKGGFLGLSGNSGGSFGPHLHFEIRDTAGNIPLNPLNHGFAIKDQTNPKIKWLMLYPIDTYSSRVDGTDQKLLVMVNEKNGKQTIVSDTIEVIGKIGMGIEAYDYLDNSLNECGPYTISLKLDDNQIFFCRIDSIPFSLTEYIDSYYDYGEIIRSGKKIQKLFIDPNNKLNIYKEAINRGIIQLNDSKVHAVKIAVRDTYGNETVLKFFLRASNDLNAARSPVRDSTVVGRFFCDSLNVYENHDIRIAVPQDALFDNVDFQYKRIINDSISFSAIHQVQNIYTPLFKSYILSIKPVGLPASLNTKALIASRGSKGNWVSQGGEYKNGFVTTRVKVFGQFIVTVDTVSPIIRPMAFNPGGRYAEGQVISFNIADSLSGIRKYAGYIDKKWALFEYDAKNDLLNYSIDGGRLDKKMIHHIEIYVTDNKENVTHYKSDFYF
jgi:hypothetical protein